jgi:arylsulfatase A-like enzyme
MKRKLKNSAQLLWVAAATSLTAPCPVLGDPPACPKYNVLFIISDDMRAEPGSFGGIAKTPNIDALARSGVRFERGYAQYPLCCPSRSSLLTGHAPTHTGVLGNRTWVGDLHPEFTTLPRWFKDHGYITARSGKIFHDGIDDTEAWNEGGEARWLAGFGSETNASKKARLAKERHPARVTAIGLTNGVVKSETPVPEGALRNADTGQNEKRSDSWIILAGNGETDHDYRVANKTIEQLGKYQHTNFFIACGFAKPHSPPSAPQSCYDLYPLDQIQLPVNFAPRPTVPEGFPKLSIRPKNADLFIGRDATTNAAKEVIRAYLASCSYVDQNVGRVLTELDRLNLRTNTIIVFWGDHGYQLGERGKWSKAGSLFEQGARVPYVIYLPSAAGNGQICERVVETLDFYPTLVDLCGLPAPKDLEGRSLAPLLQNPQAEWNHPAFTVWSENGKTLQGIGVRNERWRYAEFEDGTAMLFDEQNDPRELKNVADDPQNRPLRAELSALVRQYGVGYRPTAGQL